MINRIIIPHIRRHCQYVQREYHSARRFLILLKTKKQLAPTIAEVTTQVIGNTMYRLCRSRKRANTVNTQAIRKRQVPATVSMAGSADQPTPRIAAAGIS